MGKEKHIKISEAIKKIRESVSKEVQFRKLGEIKQQNVIINVKKEGINNE